MVSLEHNNTIYVGGNMIYPLANPIQCEDNDVRIDLGPKLYDQNNYNTQFIPFLDVTSVPVYYDGLITCIVVRKPTKYEVGNCERIDLTSKLNWGTY